jgi:serine/threonine protein kinase/predicted Zn-dependent protease
MLNPGQTIANFKVLKRLGEGGMGEVYLAEDQKLHRKVALKVLPAEYFDDPERQKRFQREAETAAQVSHPHVMSIYDIGTTVDPETNLKVNYIVMEHVEGVPLTEYLRSRPNDMATVVRLAEKIAAGLAAAHKLHIVHRDIKPSNIMVNSDGEPKILDFGLAKPLDPLQWQQEDDSTQTISQQLTKAGSIVGTVSYMSPEQARGEPVDARSDIFSFGVLLYRMATGKLPFEESTPVSTLAKILESKPQPPRAVNTNVPEDLERIIDKCLQKDPNDRYQDTRDLVVDLRNLRRQFDSGPSDTFSSDSIVSAKSGKTSNLKLRRTQAAILIGLVILAVVIWLGTGDKSDSGIVVPVKAGENSLAIISFDNKTGDTTLEWLETGLPEILLTDLAQTKAINLISRDRLVDYLGRKSEEQSYTYAELVKAAHALGATNLLSGAFYKFGEAIRIDARMEEVGTGKILMGEKVVGKDVFTLVDSLTEKIAERLDIKLEMSSVSVSDVTSSSTEAYRLYHEGMKKFDLNLFDESIEKFKKALEIDPGFALAYMRIGMAHVFMGRPQEGARYLALAREHRDRLPILPRSLLEIYAGFWLDRKFDDAIVRLESFVSNFPEHKEARSIYALVHFQIFRDTVAAFAQLDTVLQMDSTYHPALVVYSQIYSALGQIDRSAEFVRRIRQYHPGSPYPYLELADLYQEQGKLDEAINELRDMLRMFPKDMSALMSLSNLYIYKREFDSARYFLERIAENYGDDPYKMQRNYNQMANLAVWRGKFRSAMQYRFQSLQQALTTGDSMLIANQYQVISVYYLRFGMPDSAKHYIFESFRWGNAFQRASYPLIFVQADPQSVDEVRPQLKKSLDEFRSRLPSELWPLADMVESLFEAYAQHDTATLIDGYEKLAEMQNQQAGINVWEAARLRVLSGQYEEGKRALLKYLTGQNATTNGYRYVNALYLIGIADEELGNTKEAVHWYEEMLKYWGDPEIELKVIKDARTRLAKLTS